MKSTIFALLAVVLVASALETAAGARPVQLAVPGSSRRLRAFEVTTNLSPLDTYAIVNEEGTGRTFVQVVDSPLFGSSGGGSALGSIVKSVFGALNGFVAGGGTILEKVVELAQEED